MNILVIGCGQLGLALVQQLHQQGHHITTISRSPKIVPEGVLHICKDIYHLQANDFNDNFDMVYVILSANQRDKAGYQHTYVNTAQPIYQALSQYSIQKIIYISSTRVYGENHGEWVNDDTPLSAQDDLAECLIQAEYTWRDYWKEKLVIMRPSGLLRNMIFWQQQAEKMTEINEYRWLNFIYQHDVVKILALLPQLDMSQLKSSYILTSHQPILRHEFLNHLRSVQNLTAISIPSNLSTTGKRLQASNLQALLAMIHIKLQLVY
ncbi:NAD-dependent epimerase/dehydratase family protein [Moraxella sp. ZY210820]|uniref:NAD-dependent epimerase/dehydratase family protein n=1 Tax=unclassified Moraxella TaxID=2685852 RepID=UPI00272F64C3|nr:NAD-dependent epimerase/dehydratase family protein [Moraxella sp. ZY210820]WLF84155.1 NAD-dependent epimerase/dehydratase family protein [Moraxella sp. ZY210820]